MGDVTRRGAPDRGIEGQADALLGSNSHSDSRPARTERALARQGSRFGHTVMGEHEVAPPDQSVIEELLSLSDMAGLEGDEGRYYQLWVYGWSELQTALRCGVSRWHVRRHLRAAQLKCLEWLPVSFREFSRRTIYRAPARGWQKK